MLPKGSWQIKETQCRGLKTAWLEAGEPGKPVAFLCHGFPDDPTTWSYQIEFLEPHYHVIAPFVRGCDRSEPAEEVRRYGSEAVLLDHLQILNESSSERVTVFGHDLGAVHGLNLARALGARLDACVIINGGDVELFSRRLSNPRQVTKSWYMAVMQVPVLPEALFKFAPEACSWLAATVGGVKPLSSSSQGMERRTVGPLNQYRAFAAEMVKNRGERSSRLKAPILVLWGRDDGFLEHPTRIEWERVGLSVMIRILPGGHWIHREQSTEVNDVVGEFLNIATDKGSTDESQPRDQLSTQPPQEPGVTH